jgi:short-subunit dehydrogenase
MSLNHPIKDWRGQRVWLIGASTGIGHATALKLLAAGAHLALTARKRESLDELAAQYPDQCLVLPADVTDSIAFTAARDQLLAAWPRLDLVWFNAGTYEPTRAWTATVDGINKTIALNVTAAMHCVPLLMPSFLAQAGGAFAFTSSVAGYRGLPKALAYGTSKAALSHFAECLYLDCRNHKAGHAISVYLICPGFVSTPLTANNKFKMTALITPEVAADEIIKGFGRGVFEIHFPKRFSLFLKTLQLLPHRLYFAITSKLA